jgi:hypothetical protein
MIDLTGIDDFFAARSASLAHGTVVYTCWLDTDDRVEPQQ